jgi:hypothetical protein
MDAEQISKQSQWGRSCDVKGAPARTGAGEEPKVNVIAHIDATDGVVEPFLVARMDDFEKVKTNLGNRIDVTAEVFRAGKTPKAKILTGLGNLGAHLAIPAAGFAIGGVVGLAIGGLIDAGMFLLGITRHGLGELMSGVYHRKHLPEPDWKGMRTYNIAPDRTPAIDTTPTSRNESMKKPSVAGFGNFIASSIKKFPCALNIVFVSGHGLGHKQVASMRVRDLRSSLEMAQTNAGKKPDIIMMESCLMGNMEAMAELRNSAKVAVVSEEVLNATALPLKDMLADAAVKGGTPQEIGRRMVELAGKEGGIETLAAIDLEKMEPVLKSLDTLGTRLLEEIRRGKKEEIQAAAKEAMKFPQGKMMFLERRLLNFSDLGGFLSALEDRGLEPATKRAVSEAKRAIGEAVIARISSDDYKVTTGMSFQAKEGALLEAGPDMGKYRDADIPESWKDLIGELWEKEKKA